MNTVSFFIFLYLIDAVRIIRIGVQIINPATVERLRGFTHVTIFDWIRVNSFENSFIKILKFDVTIHFSYALKTKIHNADTQASGQLSQVQLTCVTILIASCYHT